MPQPPKPGQWVPVKMSDGSTAMVTTGRRNGRRVVIIRTKREAQS